MSSKGLILQEAIYILAVESILVENGDVSITERGEVKDFNIFWYFHMFEKVELFLSELQDMRHGRSH